LKKEYISFVGAAGEFKKHLLACAPHNGYGRFKETVVLSDGAHGIEFVKVYLHKSTEIFEKFLYSTQKQGRTMV
jgi:hypothetical protein